MTRSYLGELGAEFLGTMILIFFGVGSVAQVVTSPDGSLGDHDTIAWAWGFGVMFGVYVAGRISGGHLNPAVTIAMAAFQGFPWRKVIPYSLAQIAGAFVAALIVRIDYADLLAKFDPGHTAKSQLVFSTLPGNGVDGVGVPTAFLDQVVGTAILVFIIFALVERRNNPPLANLAPVAIGLVVVGIGMTFGANAGYAINPARDFGPRLASFATGFASAWYDQHGHLYFWLPIVAPVIGGLLGGGLFQLVINRSLPAGEPDESVSRG